YSESSTKTREPHRQISPWLENDERTVVASIASKSQSAKTSTGFLPPSSSESFLNSGAATPAIRAPVFVPPVNEIAFTDGCVQIGSPASGPVPWMIFNTPAGKPASPHSSANSVAVRGVTSDGLPTTQLPAASAGAIFQVNRYSGRFHGEMLPTTPSGWRSV